MGYRGGPGGWWYGGKWVMADFWGQGGARAAFKILKYHSLERFFQRREPSAEREQRRECSTERG